MADSDKPKPKEDPKIARIRATAVLITAVTGLVAALISLGTAMNASDKADKGPGDAILEEPAKKGYEELQKDIEALNKGVQQNHRDIEALNMWLRGYMSIVNKATADLSPPPGHKIVTVPTYMQTPVSSAPARSPVSMRNAKPPPKPAAPEKVEPKSTDKVFGR